MKWVNKGMLHSYFPASDIFAFLWRSGALINDSSSSPLPLFEEAPTCQSCSKGCHVPIVTDEITLAHNTSLYLLICLFKCSVFYCQGLFYWENVFMLFQMYIFESLLVLHPVPGCRIVNDKPRVRKCFGLIPYWKVDIISNMVLETEVSFKGSSLPHYF